MAKKIPLTVRDEALFAVVRATIESSMKAAEQRPALARKVAAYGTRWRNKGRVKAIKDNPFTKKCAKSGLPITREQASLDEMDPTKGYEGPVQWVCKKANCDGKFSCGSC